MTHSERESEFLVKIARLRTRLEDLVEELGEAGLDKTANRVRLASNMLNDAQQVLMAGIRDTGAAAGRKR